MGQSKRYKGKACTYCAVEGISSTNDHVLARSFFFDGDCGNLPQVPACAACNSRKSVLENYVGSTLLIGSNLLEGNRYRQEKVAPRLTRNAKLARELGLGAPPQWIMVNGVLQPMHAIKVNTSKIEQLMQMIVKGLYRHHFDKPLSQEMFPDVKMFAPKHEATMWASIEPYFPSDTPRVGGNLGRGAFMYSGVKSPAHDGFTAWEMAWHGRIRLHGQGGEGADHWWCVTRPTPEALALT